MSKRRETIANRCPKCAINMALCFCNHISSIPTKTRTSVIIHIKEYFLTSNTGKIATLALDNSDFYIRGKLNEPIEVDYTDGGKYEPYYLFPSQDATILDDNFISKMTKPIHLVVPDATWRQAKKFHKREPSLKDLPHLKLPNIGGSIYELRKQKFEAGLCTIEAIATSIGLIEGEYPKQHLLKILKVMNDRVMEARAKR